MAKKRGRPKGDRVGWLKARIVAAATKEFARVGYDGARIEAIARASGCNRGMIYFYFGGKKRLFEAALDDVAERRMALMDAQPGSLAEGLVYWVHAHHATPVSTRLVMQEALACAPGGPSPTRRQTYHDRQLQVVREFQTKGLLRADLDPRHLLALFVAVTIFPASFPILATVSLGAADEQDMLTKWCEMVEELATLLTPEREGPKAPQPAMDEVPDELSPAAGSFG